MQSPVREEPGNRRDAASSEGERQRVLDVLEMHRLARRADGGAALVRWLARRTGSRVCLLDPRGGVLI